MTDTDKPHLGAGDVPIVIDGDEYVLRPSLRAAQQISRKEGGIVGAINRVLQMDIDTVTQIVIVGIGLTEIGAKKLNLHERLWQAGMTDDSGRICDLCVKYLRILANGGRLPKDQQDGDVDAGGDGEASQDTADPRPAPRSSSPSTTGSPE
jgi:hypothetical protein